MVSWIVYALGFGHKHHQSQRVKASKITRPNKNWFKKYTAFKSLIILILTNHGSVNKLLYWKVTILLEVDPFFNSIGRKGNPVLFLFWYIAFFSLWIFGHIYQPVLIEQNHSYWLRNICCFCCFDAWDKQLIQGGPFRVVTPINGLKKWVTRVITATSGVITLLVTGRGPHCMYQLVSYHVKRSPNSDQKWLRHCRLMISHTSKKGKGLGTCYMYSPEN